MTNQQDLSKIVVARTAQGDLVAAGRCIAYCDAPTVTLETPDGMRVHWRADMCEALPIGADVVELLMPSKGKTTRGGA